MPNLKKMAAGVALLTGATAHAITGGGEVDKATGIEPLDAGLDAAAETFDGLGEARKQQRKRNEGFLNLREKK